MFIALRHCSFSTWLTFPSASAEMTLLRASSDLLIVLASSSVNPCAFVLSTCRRGNGDGATGMVMVLLGQSMVILGCRQCYWDGDGATGTVNGATGTVNGATGMVMVLWGCTFSDPARSTRYNFPVMVFLVSLFSCLMEIRKTAWRREL